MAAITDVTLTAGVPTAGSGTVTTLDKFNALAGATTTQALVVQGNASGTPIPISVASLPSHAVTNAGTFAVQVTSAPSTAVTNAGTFAVQATLSAETTKVIGTVNVASSQTIAVTQATASSLNATVKLTDGTNLGTIKAVSTAPVTATDTALVTVLRPDSAGIINVGTAGSASANVLSVQGIASMTPVITTATVTATANGSTPSRINAAASTNATSLKASAGQLYKISVFNVAAYNVFLKLYNKASAPTVGTDTPVMTIPIQAGGGYSDTWPMGFPFSTGIAYAITKLQADSDTTVVAAGDLTGNTIWI